MEHLVLIFFDNLNTRKYNSLLLNQLVICFVEHLNQYFVKIKLVLWKTILKTYVILYIFNHIVCIENKMLVFLYCQNSSLIIVIIVF